MQLTLILETNGVPTFIRVHYTEAEISLHPTNVLTSFAAQGHLTTRINSETFMHSLLLAKHSLVTK